MKTLYNFFVLVRQIHERIYTHYQTLSSILNNEFILFCHIFILIIIKLLSDEVSSYTVVDFKREIIVESKICIMKILYKISNNALSTNLMFHSLNPLPPRRRCQPVSSK